MEKRNLLFGIGGLVIAGVGIHKLLKKNSKKKEITADVVNIPNEEGNNNSLILSYDQIIKRLTRYSSTAGKDKAVFTSAYLESLPQPENFPKEYYLFCINTFNGDISISIISGTHKNGIITQNEVLYFNRSWSSREYPRFKVESDDKETLEDLTKSSKKLQEMKYGSYYFGNCIWDGEESANDFGWYRSLENRDDNNWIIAKKGGPVEVRALVSKTVFDKLKALQGDLYDIPAANFLDQLDKIFEEEIIRSRTKQEIEG